jgi:hypothetical protein
VGKYKFSYIFKEKIYEKIPFFFENIFKKVKKDIFFFEDRASKIRAHPTTDRRN